METQTMVTIGDNDYVRSAPVIVHELVHQWYGDQVSPADWRDVWLNEGMTMLMQGLWESDHKGDPIKATISALARRSTRACATTTARPATTTGPSSAARTSTTPPP